MSDNLTYSILAFVFLMVFSGYLAFLELFKAKINWFRAILFLGFFCFAIIFGLMQILSNDEASSQTKKEILDSVSSNASKIQDSVKTSSDRTNQSLLKLDSGVGAIDLKIDSTNQILKNIDNLKPSDEEDDPLFDIFAFPGQANPIVLPSHIPDSFLLKMTIVNVRKAEGYGLLKRGATVVFINGNPVVLSAQIEKVQTRSTPIYSTENLSRNLYINGGFIWDCVKNKNDTLYFCISLEYANKSGKKQRPMNKIYRFTCDKVNSQLPEEIRQFETIKKELLRLKAW